MGESLADDLARNPKHTHVYAIRTHSPCLFFSHAPFFASRLPHWSTEFQSGDQALRATGGIHDDIEAPDEGDQSGQIAVDYAGQRRLGGKKKRRNQAVNSLPRGSRRDITTCEVPGDVGSSNHR